VKGGLLAAPIEQVLADARLFPVHVDFDRNCLILIETSRDRLMHTPFLDGRTPIGEGIALEVPLREAVEADWSVTRRPDRFIFHVAFCGSTLLATLLDIEGRTFAEREPHVLVELANAWGHHDPALVRSTLELMRDLLRRPWHSGEVNICKPSNWANPLIPLLTAEPARIRPLFLTTSKRSYLHSLFRGGRERMVYVIRATEHLLKHTPDGAQLWHRATAGTDDPLERAARIALASLHVQLQLFEQVMIKGGWGSSQVLTLDEIEEDPLGACMFASAALELNLSARELDRVIAERVHRYAKDPSTSYSTEWTASQNRQIDANYGRVIDRALDWAALSNLKDDSALLRGDGSRDALSA
jgi:hypothetical protein